MSTYKAGLCFMYLIVLVNQSLGLTCGDILETSEDKTWSVEELKTMAGEEVDKCLSQLGKVKLTLDQSKVIWHTLKKFYGGAGEIPNERLSTLHWITVAVKPKDYKNISLSNIDVIENFGLFYDLTVEQMLAIAKKVKRDWSKRPEDYTSYDLTALKQILCAFRPSQISRIHPSAYKEAASVVGMLKKCPMEVLEAFAMLAVQEKAFSSPGTWKETVISTVGVVMDALPPDMLQMIPEHLIKDSKNRISQTTREFFNARKNWDSIKP